MPAMIGKWLVIIGGVNWGLIGIGMFMNQNWNVVHMILGFSPTIEAIVYILVGIAAVMKIFGCRCKKCMSGTCATDAPQSMPGKM
jgi:uncharacterized membrane protein YuzA (DUF378 family)